MIKTTIKIRISTGFICVFIIMLAVALFLVLQLIRVTQQTQLLYEHPFKVSNAVGEINTEIYLNANIVKEIQNTDNLRQLDSLKAIIDSNNKIILNGFQIIYKQYLGNKTSIDSALNAYTGWKNIGIKIYRCKKENKADSLQYMVKFDKQANFNKIIYFLTVISDFAKNKATNTLDNVVKVGNKAVIMSIALLIIACLIVIFFIWYLPRSISKPLRTFVEQANVLMKKDGNLQVKVLNEEEVLMSTLEELKKTYRNIEKQGEEHYRSLFNNMLNGYAYCKMEYIDGIADDFTYLTVNDAFSELTGLQEVVGKKISEIIPDVKKTSPELIAIYGRVASSGRPERFETYLEPLSMWFSISVYSPKKDHFVAVFDVITERKKAEELLNATIKSLEQSNKELEQFAYVASHDLQEPLRTISSYTQLLARRYKDKIDTDATEFIDYIVNGSARMQKLINDLLEYSRLNTRKKTHEPVDCHALIGVVMRNLAGIIEYKKALITCDKLPQVIADENKMIQLFQNLVGNGIKYNESKTPHIHVSAKEEINEWKFSIKDNGIGIEKQYHDRIFLIFQRLHSRDAYSGTGIGLAICKRIVDQHKGRIWLESEPGKGSVFYFSLPK